MPDAQVDMLNSDQVRDLEEQIQSATLTPGEAREYFDAPALAIGFLHGGKGIATTSQIEQLAHKNRTAVKGLNPWEDGRIDFFPEESRTEKLKLPEPKPCEFCGRPREYLAILNHTKHLYEWEVEKWSQIPKHCDCEEARVSREAEEAERQRQEEEERRQREEDERKRRIQTQLARSGMKSRFLTRTFANFQTNTQRRTQAARTAREYADNFTAHRENGDGLYIEGTYGTGKTHLAAAISIQLMEQGYSVIFGTADDLLREIKATFDDNGSEQKVLERFKHCDLLVIDDLGKEQATDWSTAQLYAIINDRYECQKPLIITTNFGEADLIAVESPKGVGNHRIQAILSRLHETCRAMTMDWQDWRGAQ